MDLPGINTENFNIQFFLEAWNNVVLFIGNFINAFVQYFFPVFLAITGTVLIGAITWRVVRALTVGK